MRRVVGMGGVFLRLFGVMALVVVFVAAFGVMLVSAALAATCRPTGASAADRIAILQPVLAGA